MISRKGIPLVVMCLLVSVSFLQAQGQSSKHGTVVVPNSSVEHPGDVGVRAHTNFLIFVPAAKGGRQPQPYAGSATPTGETPGSLSCLYKTWAGDVAGCPINGGYSAPSGGSKVIAIVDAFDYPTACHDFNVFSSQFGLPTANCNDSNDPHFRVVYAGGSKPSVDCGWAQEAALDIEWAHAMAPNAQIILVEAASNYTSDLLQAVQVASNLVAGAGGGEVSMSWGGSEFRSESTYDSYFSNPKVAYFGSSGDSGGKVIWPSASAYVLSAGGTSVNRDSNGNFTSESAWSGAGGGASRFVPVPDYQSGIYSLAQLLNGKRGTPDLSFDADPYTGVSVYDSTPCQGYVDWMVFGGTSVSSPSLAGVVNYTGDLSASQGVLSNVYQTYSDASSAGTACGYTSTLYDVTTGSNGRYSATGCWDFASGVGTPRVSGSGSSGGSSGSFTLSASSSLSVTQGSSNSETVTVNPSGGYSDSVSFSLASPPPSGITVGFNPNPTSSSNSWASTMKVTADATASAPSTFTLAVVGTDPNNNSVTAQTSVTVTVNAASSGGGDFSLSATPGNVTLKGGGTATYSITVTPSGNFSDPVTFDLSGQPSDTQNFSFTSTGSGSITLSITVGSNRTDSTLVITGTSGSLSHSVSVGLKVR